MAGLPPPRRPRCAGKGSIIRPSTPWCDLPLDANRAETFLGLPRTLGESMDRDHVATIVFAHWPSQADTFYGDLRRMAAYGAVLGKFITLEEYFTNTASPGEMIKFKADGYRAPYLRRPRHSSESQPISGVTVRQHAGTALRSAIGAWGCSMTMMCPAAANSASRHNDAAAAEAECKSDAPDAAAQRLAQCVAPPGRASGLLVVNPHSFARRELVDVSACRLAGRRGYGRCRTRVRGAAVVVADVPG